MANVNVSLVSRVSSARTPVGKEPTDEDVWESVTVQTMLRYVTLCHICLICTFPKENMESHKYLALLRELPSFNEIWDTIGST